MKIYGFNNNGVVCGRDIYNWNNIPNGIILSNTLITNYVDISNIETWNKYGYKANDYLIAKTEITNLVNSITWNNLNDTEKQIAIDYFAYLTDSDKVIYLISTGLSQSDAELYLLQAWHKHNLKLIEACKQRWDYAKIIVPMYLSFQDATTILKQIESLVLSFTTEGLFGIDYGDTTSGLINYIDDTYDYSTTGLGSNNFTFNNGATLQNVRDALKDILVNGNYNIYV